MISRWFDRLFARRAGDPSPAFAGIEDARFPGPGIGRTTLFEHLDASARSRLAGLARDFLQEKRVIGAHDYEPDALDRRRLAALACLPVLRFGLAAYGRFVDVIVYPDAFVAHRSKVDPAGVWSEWDDVLAGEAMDDGPVVLSAPGLVPPAPGQTDCLVIHEFAHKLDHSLGLSDRPDAAGRSVAARLARELGTAYADFTARVEALEDTLPAHLDPESPEADAWYGRLALDPYAATEPVEFFAVCTEAFFCGSADLASAYPELDHALSEFFDQRPVRNRTARPVLKYD